MALFAPGIANIVTVHWSSDGRPRQLLVLITSLGINDRFTCEHIGSRRLIDSLSSSADCVTVGKEGD